MEMPPSPNDSAHPNPMTDYKFEAVFSKGVTDQVRGKASRPFPKGLGEFKSVLEHCEATSKAAQAHRDAPTNPKKIGDLNRASAKLEEKAGDYLEKRKYETERDDKAQTKINITEAALSGARIVRAQLTLGAPELTQLKHHQASVDSANSLDSQRERIDAMREHEAQLYSRRHGTTRPDGGTSDVQLIHGPDKKVAFVFKSVEGEAPSMGMPNGAGAVRELLASRVCEAIKQSGGPDFGWPHASLCMHDGKLGALVDGIQGQKILDKDGVANLTGPKAEIDFKRQMSEKRFEQLPDKEIQKTALCNIALAQFDIKWDNVFVEKKGLDQKPELTTRPYDGGAAFPGKELFMNTVLLDRGGAMAAEGLCKMQLVGGEQKEHPTARAAAMDERLLDQFRSINVPELRKVMNATLDEAQRAGIAPAVVADAREGCKLMADSLASMQTVLANPENTKSLQHCIDACHDHGCKLVADEHKEEWLNGKVADYQQMRQDPKYTEFLPPVEKFMTRTPEGQMQLTEDGKKEIAKNFMHPTQLETLEQLVKLGKPAILGEMNLTDRFKDKQSVELAPSGGPKNLKMNYENALKENVVNNRVPATRPAEPHPSPQQEQPKTLKR